MKSESVKPNQLQRIAMLEKNSEALSAGVRVSQMLIKQMVAQIQQINQQFQIQRAAFDDLQYKLLALQSVTGVDVSKVQVEADLLKLKEWTKASAADTLEKKLISATEVVDEENTVVFTSTTPEAAVDSGVFRSKIKLSELGSKEAIEAFKGKKVQDVFEVQLAGQKHLVSLLEVFEEQKA